MKIDLPRPKDVWTLELIPVDTTGNEGCGKLVLVNGDVSAPEPPSGTTGKILWYDVAGRRYKQKPTTPGIYIVVDGVRRRKLVLIH